ncbi:MAG: MarR family transcriptional regulator [Actinomycetota bacterium]|nr:MarR family transcriptional regulator [Actinomycetota bacterium]
MNDDTTTDAPTSDAPTSDAAGPGSDTDHLELAARLRLAVARLARRLRQQSGSGLSLSLQSALAAIDVRGPLSLGELATIERIAPPTVTKFVGRLEEDGLVERRRAPDDGRVTLLTVTPAGRAQLEASRHRRNAWLAVRLDDLSPDELATLADAVRILERLERTEDPT